VNELNKPAANARSTAHPRVVETVDPHFECVKPLFDVVSVDVVDLTVQSQPREGGPIAKLIDEKHRLGEVVVLTKPMNERGCWIRSVTAE
jgi:hypothetical protein